MIGCRPVLSRTIGLLCALAVVGLASVPAYSQGLDDASVFFELPGVCETGDFAFGVGVDCAIGLTEQGVAEVEALGPLWAYDVAGELSAAPCALAPDGRAGLVEGPAVICEDLGHGFSTIGTNRFELLGAWEPTTFFEFDHGEPTAPFWVLRPHSVRFGDRAVRLWVSEVDPIEEMFLEVVPKGSTERVAVLPATDAVVEIDEFGIAELAFLPEVEPGEYRLWFCRGTGSDECERTSGGWALQVLELDPIELIPGHNVVDAERINVVFFGTALDRVAPAPGFETIERAARTLLGWSGPTGTFSSIVEDGFTDGFAPIQWGPFATEPLASNRHRFNLWVVETPLANPDALFSDITHPGLHEGFGLPNTHAVLMRSNDERYRSDAHLASFADLTEFPTEASQVVFGHTRVSLDPFLTSNAIQVLTHEWGHALFGLRDEYALSPPGGIGYGSPNCTVDEAEAERLWGDRLGEIDPFAEIVLEQVEALGRDPEQEFVPPLLDQVRIEPTAGGCYGSVDDPAVLRPNGGSLMSETNPVFGSVNRSQVEAVLELFSGWAPYRGLDAVRADCATDGTSTTCDLELPPYVETAPRGFAIDDLPCTPLGPEADRRRSTCRLDVALDTVTLTDGLDRRIVEVTPAPPPSTTTTRPPTDDEAAETATPATTPAATDDGGISPVAIALVVVAAAGVFGVLAVLSRRPRAGDEPPTSTPDP